MSRRATAAVLAAILLTGIVAGAGTPALAQSVHDDRLSGHVARPELTGGQALVIVAASSTGLAVWVLLLVVTKPRIDRWALVRRFPTQLRGLDSWTRSDVS